MITKIFRIFIVVTILGLFFAGNLYAENNLSQRKKEVIDFVNEGLVFAKKHGKKAFLDEIMKEDSQFKRGTLYFYAYDFEGTVLSHGSKPELVGKNLIDLKDKKGKKLIKALIAKAKKGSGWVEYYWENPVTKKVEKKLGYVVKVDDTYWFGSGLYIKE